ncbi:Phospholipase_D-nuclease N-terminal [Tessaracoccus bendigoensis DSM 12906]|uniref:Phospholipase_D-nuclease N-terminal n=1 Tax=Tessaracoccus bendigoensis DSM 12906 TaxID=1123357 RepID=A0A1M6DXE2_9ACTN|nr:PLD nuclease N-terminal domain-containing protein [Tessaracoccus bendigoensis]SHI77872.1 Phospholipase_D-nuclease N-terminal [Tessaracoccus bendigoensis DSM 12906]
MVRVLLIIAIVMLTVYCVVEVAQAQGYRVRRMPRWLWAFAVICLPVVGPVCWLFLGRPVKQPGLPPRGSQAPDDDEDFLRGLR